MDGYWLGKLFFDACRDLDLVLVNEYKVDPEAVLARYRLSEGARRAVLDRDLRTIYEAGVHPLLVRMGANALYGPMPTPDYRQAIAGAVQVNY